MEGGVWGRLRDGDACMLKIVIPMIAVSAMHP